MAYTYSKIATYTVGSGGVASISFLNIPQNYTDLQILISARSNRASQTKDLIKISFNGSTSNLSERVLYTNSTTVTSYSGTDGEIGTATASSSTVNTFANFSVYITNYTSSNYKSFSSDAVQEGNITDVNLQLLASLWSNTSAINSITLTPLNASFVQYTTAHLYGIKAEL
jgi:hypothetical protein